MKKKKVNKLIKKYEEKKERLESYLSDPNISEEGKLTYCGELWVCRMILRDLKENKK